MADCPGPEEERLMSISEYLEAGPFTELVKYKDHSPQDAVAFVGTIRKHPYDEDKCLLIADPTGREPAIFEFRAADIIAIDELASPVAETGQSRPLARLWVRRGSYGIRYEPFEVDDPLRFPRESIGLRERLMGGARNWS
jgi:hypothetical protein